MKHSSRIKEVKAWLEKMGWKKRLFKWILRLIERKVGHQRDFLKLQGEFGTIIGVVRRKICFLAV